MRIEKKIGETDLTIKILYILQKYGEMDTTRLKSKLKESISIEGANMIPLMNRNDYAIDQIIRNVICHRRDSQRNIIYRGLVGYNDGTLWITARGESCLEDYIDLSI